MENFKVEPEFDELVSGNKNSFLKSKRKRERNEYELYESPRNSRKTPHPPSLTLYNYMEEKIKELNDYQLQLVVIEFTGVPGGIRTHDPKIRNLVLYPTELRAHAFFIQIRLKRGKVRWRLSLVPLPLLTIPLPLLTIPLPQQRALFPIDVVFLKAL